MRVVERSAHTHASQMHGSDPVHALRQSARGSGAVFQFDACLVSFLYDDSRQRQVPLGISGGPRLVQRPGRRPGPWLLSRGPVWRASRYSTCCPSAALRGSMLGAPLCALPCAWHRGYGWCTSRPEMRERGTMWQGVY